MCATNFLLGTSLIIKEKLWFDIHLPTSSLHLYKNPTSIWPLLKHSILLCHKPYLYLTFLKPCLLLFFQFREYICSKATITLSEIRVGLERASVRVDHIYTLAEMSVMFCKDAHLHIEDFNCIGLVLLALGLCCFHSTHWVLITFACDAFIQCILWWMCFFFFFFFFLFSLIYYATRFDLLFHLLKKK